MIDTHTSGARLTGVWEYPVRIDCIPVLVDRLQSEAGDGTFAVLMFSPPNTISASGKASYADCAVNFLYAVRSGSTGLEWNLDGARNILDAERVRAFCSSRGYTVKKICTDDLQYLRIENGDLGELGVQIVTVLYDTGVDVDLGMFVSDSRILREFLSRPATVRTMCFTGGQIEYHVAMMAYHEVMYRYLEDTAASDRDALYLDLQQVHRLLSEFLKIVALEDPDAHDMVENLSSSIAVLSRVLKTLRGSPRSASVH